LSQSEYNQRLKGVAPLMDAALRWLTAQTRLAPTNTRPSSFPQLATPTGAEAIIWTLKRQLGLEHHAGRVPAGSWARVVQSLLYLNTAIWHNWAIGAPVKRSLIAYDHRPP
jgi:hypothetical protein